MAKEIRVRSVRRREIDEDKLAVAFLLLAKILAEQEQAATGDVDAGKAEAA